MSQRNALLKNPYHKDNELFVWNIRLSELGGKIFKERIQLVEKLNKEVSKLYKSMSNSRDKIELVYKTNINTANYETSLLKKLENETENERVKGFTSFGPHRDDLQIVINNKIAGEVASRGETRTILLALKMIETSIIENARQQKPLLLFDDVFSELDGSRRVSLVNTLKNYQTIITTTDADVVVQHFTETAHIIPLG